MDSIDHTKNLGLKIRYDKVKGSASIELMGKVHGDMLNQNKLLLNNVDLRVVFTVERPEFYIMEAAAGTATVIFQEATMYLNHVTVSPTVMLQNEARLLKQPAVYPYRRVEVKAYTIPSDQKSVSLDTVSTGIMPNLLILAMLTNKAYTGSRTLNPYNFQHFRIRQFNVVASGRSIPLTPYSFDYSTSGNVTKCRSIHFSNSNLFFYWQKHQNQRVVIYLYLKI